MAKSKGGLSKKQLEQMGHVDWVREAKKMHAQLNSWADERDAFYYAVKSLIEQSKETENDENLRGNPEARPALLAASKLRVELEAAVEEYNERDPGDPEEDSDALLFAQTSIDAIYRYQPSIQAHPSLWNQIKMSVNNVLERWLSIKPFLVAESAVFQSDSEFKGRFEEVKKAGEQQIEDLKGNYSPGRGFSRS